MQAKLNDRGNYGERHGNLPLLPSILWFTTMEWLDKFSLMQLQLCSLKSGIWTTEETSEHSLRRTC